MFRLGQDKTEGRRQCSCPQVLSLSSLQRRSETHRGKERTSLEWISLVDLLETEEVIRLSINAFVSKPVKIELNEKFPALLFMTRRKHLQIPGI